MSAETPNSNSLVIYRPEDPSELNCYARYGVEDQHPEFKDGDRVWVSNLLPGVLVFGEIRGIVMRNIADVWIVDFGAPVSEMYPFPCVPVSHGQFLTPKSAEIATVKWAESRFRRATATPTWDEVMRDHHRNGKDLFRNGKNASDEPKPESAKDDPEYGASEYGDAWGRE